MNELNLIHQDQCNDIQFYGMKRSGNHAIISWILGHFENSIHYNDCILDDKSNVFYKTCESPIMPMSEDFRKLISFEDNIDKNDSTIEYLGKYLPPAKIRVMIIRDPYNTYASRIKLSEKIKIKSDVWCNTRIWKDVAKEFLGITNYLKSSIKINYNTWFKNINYRKKISENFGKFTDKNINLVYPAKFGSSFDNFDYNGKANEMNVMHRWKSMINNKDFNKVLKDEELNFWKNKLFGNMV